MNEDHWLPVDTGVLSAIYSASVHDETWPEALDRCIDAVGVGCAALISFDTLDPSAYRLDVLGHRLRQGMTEERARYWLEHLAPLDAVGQHYVAGQPSHRLVSDTEAFGISPNALRERPDSRFLRKHLGLYRRLAVRLNDTPRYFDNLAVQFSAELDEIPIGVFKALQGVLPHLGKAVEMGQLFGQLRHRYRAVLAALDHVGLGLCVLDKVGRVIVANAEAERILDAGHGLKRLSSGALQCREATDAAALATALEGAMLSRQGERTRAESLLAVRCVPDAEPLLIDISPLRDHLDELAGGGGGGEVLVQLIDIGNADSCSVAPFAAAYSLTEAESAVAALLVEGLTNPEIAETRGTGIDTVKTQVGSLMKKARATSRVTLVRAILKSDPPIARPA